MSETPTWQQLLELVEQLIESEYESASIQFGNVSVQLSKNENNVSAVAVPNTTQTPSAPAATTAASVTPAVYAAAAPTAPDHGDTIDAPMIGAFYRRPSPGADVFVNPGDTVTDETIIGIIEIMKMMNPVAAGKAGVLGEFLVNDADTVEFGQPLVQITQG